MTGIAVPGSAWLIIAGIALEGLAPSLGWPTWPGVVLMAAGAVMTLGAGSARWHVYFESARRAVQEKAYADAEVFCRRALELLSQNGSPAAPVAIVTAQLAEVFCEQGRWAEAEPLLRTTLAHLEACAVPSSPSLGTCHYSLAAVLSNLGRYDEAESQALQALAMRERLVGPGHADSLQAAELLKAIRHNRELAAAATQAPPRK